MKWTKPQPSTRVQRLAAWLLTAVLALPVFLSAGSLHTAQAAPPEQRNIENQLVVDALSAYFATYSGHEFTSRGWVTMGDLNTIRGRLDDWDVETYVDPDTLDSLGSGGAAAAYVDYTNAGLGYFNDLVFADEPANVAGITVWHETMHAIFDVHDSDLLVDTDEIYTWYMEGQISGLNFLIHFERELKAPDCDPDDLEARWDRYVEFVKNDSVDWGGYGAITDAGKRQVAQLTGFWVPDPDTLYGYYDAAGLIENCGGTATPGPTTTAGAQPTQGSRGGQARASRMFLIDNSGSMDGARIAAAISSAQSTLSGLPVDTEVAVQFFGTSGCDVSVVQDFTLDHGAASQVIGSATAWGDTPLAAAITQGGAYMRANAGTGDMVMILLSDGEETCEGDPVEAARQLNSPTSSLPEGATPLGGSIWTLGISGFSYQRSGTITLHVVGFGISPGSLAETQLQDVAAAGLGNYYPAEDEEQLTQALQQAAEENPAAQSFPAGWMVTGGGALLCLLSLMMGGVGLVFLTRRRKRTSDTPQPAAEIPAAPPEQLTPAPPEILDEQEEEKGADQAFCTQCGKELAPQDQFCSACGTPRGGEA